MVVVLKCNVSRESQNRCPQGSLLARYKIFCSLSLSFQHPPTTFHYLNFVHTHLFLSPSPSLSLYPSPSCSLSNPLLLALSLSLSPPLSFGNPPYPKYNKFDSFIAICRLSLIKYLSKRENKNTKIQ